MGRAQEAFNRRVDAVIVTDNTTVTLTAGTQEYDLPTDLTSLVWCEWNSIILQKVDQDEVRLRADQQNWRNQQGDPECYYLVGRSIGFFPKPNASAVATQPHPYLRYVGSPLAFESTPSGLTQIADQDHSIVALYAVALWFITPNGGLMADAAQTFLNGFEREAQAVAAQYQARKLSK